MLHFYYDSENLQDYPVLITLENQTLNNFIFRLDLSSVSNGTFSYLEEDANTDDPDRGIYYWNIPYTAFDFSSFTQKGSYEFTYTIYEVEVPSLDAYQLKQGRAILHVLKDAPIFNERSSTTTFKVRN